MSNKTEHLKKDLLSALTKTRGIVTTACDKVGISRTTYYEYYNNDEDFKNEVDSLSELALDYAESKLMEKMDGVEIGKNTKEGLAIYSVPPSDTALIFYLKTKGKKRGYVERSEIDLTTKGESIKLSLDEQLAEISDLKTRLEGTKKERDERG